MPCDSTSLRDPWVPKGSHEKGSRFSCFSSHLSVFFTRETPGFPRFPKTFVIIVYYILYAITHMYILTAITHMYILTKKNGNLGNLAYF